MYTFFRNYFSKNTHFLGIFVLCIYNLKYFSKWFVREIAQIGLFGPFWAFWPNLAKILISSIFLLEKRIFCNFVKKSINKKDFGKEIQNCTRFFIIILRFFANFRLKRALRISERLFFRKHFTPNRGYFFLRNTPIGGIFSRVYVRASYYTVLRKAPKGALRIVRRQPPKGGCYRGMGDVWSTYVRTSHKRISPYAPTNRA